MAAVKQQQKRRTTLRRRRHGATATQPKATKMTLLLLVVVLMAVLLVIACICVSWNLLLRVQDPKLAGGGPSPTGTSIPRVSDWNRATVDTTAHSSTTTTTARRWKKKKKQAPLPYQIPSWIQVDVQQQQPQVPEYVMHHQQQPRYVRWVCRTNEACGGLGDRLYGVVMTFYIAMLTNRTLLLDGWWNQPQPPHSSTTGGVPLLMLQFLEPADASLAWENPFLPDQKQQQQQPQATPHDIQKIQAMDWRQHPLLLEPCQVLQPLKDLEPPPRMVEIQTNLMTHESVLRNSTCFQTYCQRQQQDQQEQHTSSTLTNCPSHNRSLFHWGFWSLFRFTDRVKQDAQALLQQQSKQKDDVVVISAVPHHQQPYVAVHIRTGPGETWDDPPRHGHVVDLRRFYSCAVTLQQALFHHCHAHHQHSSNETSAVPPIYVAADTVLAKKRIESWGQKDDTQILMANASMEILHLAKSRTTEFQDYASAYRLVWAELKVLIDSTCLVMSRSKFSQVGLELSLQQPRCAVWFDHCSSETVNRAIQAVDPVTCT